MGGKKSKKPAPPDVQDVRRPHEAAAHGRAWGIGLAFGLATTIVLLVGARLEQPGLFIAAGVLFVSATLIVTSIVGRGKLAACRALLDHGHWEAAVAGLKELQANGGDEATYLVALAYDRQEARKLALESYKAYLTRHPHGVWAVEARVRVEELEAASVTLKPPRPVDVELHCPYCKSSILSETPVAECSGCGTAHHAGCYEEQGGCAVYGCESRTARAKVRA